MSDTKSIPIHAKFRGLYDTGVKEPDLEGLASRFDFIRPREDDRVKFTRGQYVIKEAEALSHFIDCIPKTVMDFVPNPPLSDDALLQCPEIDFLSHMMLVITTYYPHPMFIDPEIARVERTSETMLVHCRYSKPGPVVNKIVSYGRYSAAVVDRFEGDIHFMTSNG